MKCSLCHKEGHFKKDYLERKLKKKGKNGDVVVAEDGGYKFVGVYIATDNKENGKWVLDLGCTFHMSLFKNNFTEYHDFVQIREL